MPRSREATAGGAAVGRGVLPPLRRGAPPRACCGSAFPTCPPPRPQWGSAEVSPAPPAAAGATEEAGAAASAHFWAVRLARSLRRCESERRGLGGSAGACSVGCCFCSESSLAGGGSGCCVCVRRRTSAYEGRAGCAGGGRTGRGAAPTAGSDCAGRRCCCCAGSCSSRRRRSCSADGYHGQPRGSSRAFVAARFLQF